MTVRRRRRAPTTVSAGPLRPNTLRDQRAPNTLGGMSADAARGTAPATAPIYGAGHFMTAGAQRSPNSQPPTAAGGRRPMAGPGAAGYRLPWWFIVLIAIGIFLLARNVIGGP